MSGARSPVAPKPEESWFSFANLSCGFLDGLCQTEDDELYNVPEPAPLAVEAGSKAYDDGNGGGFGMDQRGVERQASRRVSIKKEAVDTFKSHLKKGLMVTKHCRDGKSRPRLLFSDDHCGHTVHAP